MKDIIFSIDGKPYERAIVYGPRGETQKVRLFFFPQGGVQDGNPSTEKLAPKVVDFLNSLPIEDRQLYPWT